MNIRSSNVFWSNDKPSISIAEEDRLEVKNMLIEAIRGAVESFQGKIKELKEKPTPKAPKDLAEKLTHIEKNLPGTAEKLISLIQDQIPAEWCDKNDPQQEIASKITSYFDKLCGKFLSEKDLKLPEVMDAIDALKYTILESVTKNETLTSFIDAQKNIILGFSPYLDELTKSESASGCYWRFWPRATGSYYNWGVEFRRRVEYIDKHGGSIRFCCGTPEDSTKELNFNSAKVAIDCWAEAVKQVEGSKGDILDKEEAVRYENIQQAYAKFERLFNEKCPNTFHTVEVKPGQSRTIKVPNGCRTYFEFAYLMHDKTGHEFTLHGSEEQHKKFHEMLNKKEE